MVTLDRSEAAAGYQLDTSEWVSLDRVPMGVTRDCSSLRSSIAQLRGSTLTDRYVTPAPLAGAPAGGLIELGWAAGRGIPTCILLNGEAMEVNKMTLHHTEVLDWRSARGGAMTYYISGPMPALRISPAFEMASNHLCLLEHHVITPFDLNRTHLDTYRRQLRRDLVAICGKADAIYMLSRAGNTALGRGAEHAVAVALEATDPIRGRMSFTILTGDCREVLRGLPAASVHCCVTSPPYWGLRSYTGERA